MTPNEKAFLDMLAISEGTAHLGDRGYNVLVGGKLFDSYAKHPGIRVSLPRKGKEPLVSTAAGRYQFLIGTWQDLSEALKLKDFWPDSQDRACLHIINKWCKAGDDVREGRIAEAIKKCRKIWASLPGAGYGQLEHSTDKLLAAYKSAGGTIA